MRRRSKLGVSRALCVAVMLACLVLATQTAGAVDVDFEAVRLAVRDLRNAYGAEYPLSPEDEASLLDPSLDAAALRKAADAGDADAKARLDALENKARQALLANPLLNFDRLLLIKRPEGNLALPTNWESNSSLPRHGHDNTIVALSPVGPDGALTPVYTPPNGACVADVDLHWDGDRALVSMPGDNTRWQVHELQFNDTGQATAHQLALIHDPRVDNYDACYLPDGNTLFSSTAPFVGVPCVTGSSHVSNLYLLDANTSGIRRLTFEQDHDWCPTVLNNGRVLYLRWEYTDIPHFVSRILFSMNPDGTGQMAYYGSNSYWPNSMFYARPIPDHPSQFVAVVSGHHDTRRMGQLVLFDPERGRHEASGAVQRIPGRGKMVDPVILDGLVQGTWPMFLHPWPLSDTYFLVACKPDAEIPWGLYLVDVFDNMTLVKQEPGYALVEPVPWRTSPKPPAIAPKVDPDRKDAVVFMTDVYEGPGLAGVPRGTVKQLRLVTYHFSYHGVGGQINRVGLDGPWDIKRVIGTVPVDDDGSACFNVPANTPISIQPLDDDGRAVQLMRSWFTAMPGEVLSCTGCHESQNSVTPSRYASAARREASNITDWYGPVRGFSFVREVQPVLDRHCVRCHDGTDGKPDFRDQPPVHTTAASDAYNNGSQFTPAYLTLRGYVRTPSIESDMHLLPAMEFHAGTSELIQLLEKGHHDVRLDAEAWDRLNTWIDLHAPAHGTWREIVGEEKVARQRELRMAMLAKYTSNRTEDPEAIGEPAQLASVEAPAPQPAQPAAQPVAVRFPDGVPASAATATRTVDLGDGVVLELVRVPAGAFMMGGDVGFNDEGPATAVRIEKPFWMGRCEITNAQFGRFAPDHDSRLEHGDFLQFSVEERGYPLNGPDQPVVRVAWQRAAAFCDWLSRHTGLPFTLPTEAQWEWACRAGTSTPLSYGDVDGDFAPHANFADARYLQIDTYAPWSLPSGAVHSYRAAVAAFNDAHKVSAPVGAFAANPWGLHDMHGNAAEWTASLYRPYPYDTTDGRNAPEVEGKRVVRGGSWRDRPRRARASFRQAYESWQRVVDVGFRVVCADAPDGPKVARAGN
ncbi:MAG: formylglycine-generating enzyme family protein [bacterium]|nr:formylglycine-generating enzyme family protein [bacterium]